MAESFNDLGLRDSIIQGISELNFEKPTPVQERIIPTLLQSDGDIVCLAQTGTGKTAAFGLPLIEKICNTIESKTAGEPETSESGKKWYDFYDKEVQALVLCPTRELCRQITSDLQNYSKYIKGITIVSVYGGAGIAMQIKMLKKSPQIIVATPGRILDLINRGATDISHIHTLILDEADEMLNMGFKDELDAILQSTPADKRVLLFSATLPQEVERIAGSYMKKAEIVTVGQRNSGAQNVEHFYFVSNEKERYNTLKRIVDFCPDIYGIIFCRTRKETQDIANDLMKEGYNADALHGDLSQMQRDYVMARFKNRSLKLLVATDVAARGIDVNNLTHVINYNLPDEVEQYTHRSGRTGRADKNGISLAIINSREQHKIKRIEKIIGKEFTRAKIPTGDDICKRQIEFLMEKIKNTVTNEQMEKYLPLVLSKMENTTKEEILAIYVWEKLGAIMDYYKNDKERAGEMEPESEKREKKGEKRARGEKKERTEKAEKGEKKEDKKEKPEKRERKRKEEKVEAKEKKIEKRGKREEPEQKGTKSRVEEQSGYKESENLQEGFCWVKLNIGGRDDMTMRKLIRMMTTIGVGRKGLGKIVLRKDCSYVGVADRAAQYVVDQTNNTDYKGKRLKTCIIENLN